MQFPMANMLIPMANMLSVDKVANPFGGGANSQQRPGSGQFPYVIQ
jgi:hypothetical protein